MYYFYIVIFLVGVLYTFVSLIISGISGAMHGGSDIGSGVDGHIGHHVDIGHGHADTGGSAHINGGHHAAGHQGVDMNGDHGHTGDSGSGANSLLSWFAILINPMVAVSFLTVFGGFGIMGIKLFSWSSILIFVVAFISAIVISSILYNFVVKPIYRSENTSDVSRDSLVGIQAEVTTDILEKGYGTIQYTVNSLKYTGPAKHIEEMPVKQGRKVVICKIENNTFYVTELQGM